MNHTGLVRRQRPRCFDRFTEPFQPVRTDDQHVLHATVTQLGEVDQPLLRTFPTGSDPHAEHVAFAGEVDADRHIHRPVPDLPSLILTTMASTKTTA